MAKVLTPEQLSQQKQSAQLGVAMAVGQIVGDVAVALLQNKTQKQFIVLTGAALKK
jgi:hypothetical protein